MAASNHPGPWPIVNLLTDKLSKDEVYSCMRKGEGLVVIENVTDTGDEPTVRDVCVWMEEVMAWLGPKSGMSDFSGTPVDPECDGDENFKPAVVDGHPKIRVLGNTSDAGKPTALLANLGYQWHQDGTTNATQEKSRSSLSSNGEASDDDDGGKDHSATTTRADSKAQKQRVYSMLLCCETPERGAETLFCKTKVWFHKERARKETRTFPVSSCTD